MMEGLLIGLVLGLMGAVVGLMVLGLRRPPGGAGEVAVALQNLAHAVQQGQTQLATLSEKVAHLEPVVQTVGTVQVELRGLAERVSKVGQDQVAAHQNLGALRTGLSESKSEIKSSVSDAHDKSVSRLHQLGTSMASELAKIQQELAALQASARARLEFEQRTAESIRRLETVLAGTQSKGAAGENILEAIFAKLPIDWQVRNFSVAGKSVEFGLRLPNNLILPIDSKWTATDLLERFVAAADPDEQQKLKIEIERTVVQKAREVRKYLDPSVTVTFGVAVVPDSIYDLCTAIQADVFQENVVLVSYSMFVPYLLLVFQTTLKTNQNIDLHKLEAYLNTAQDSIQTVLSELDGRFSRAMTMLGNSRDDMKTQMSRLSSSLTGLQLCADGSAAPPTLPEA